MLSGMPRQVAIPNGPDSDVVARARAYGPLLRPGDRFSHTTAATLWGLPLPHPTTEIHVTTLVPANRPRLRGVVGHRTLDPTISQRHAMPVSTPSSLLIELGTMLSIDDLVAVGDALILDPYLLDPHDIRPWTDRETLADAAAHSRAPGCRRARHAITLMRQGAESRPETLLRLLLVRSGLPEPEVNLDIHDAAGRFLGRADLVYRTQRVIVEYDGDHHRTSKVHYERDIARLERFRDAEWHVIQVRERGLFVAPAETIARVRRALVKTS